MGSFLMVLAGYASGNTQKDEKARKLEQLSLGAGHLVTVYVPFNVATLP